MVRRISFMVCIAAVLGCGTEGPNAERVPAKGRVTFKEKPLTAAEVYFLPDQTEGNQGDMCGSSLQLDGSFTMTTPSKGDGVLPGSYKVTITTRRADPELAKYKDVKTTPLKVEVPEAGVTDLVFELK